MNSSRCWSRAPSLPCQTTSPSAVPRTDVSSGSGSGSPQTTDTPVTCPAPVRQPDVGQRGLDVGPRARRGERGTLQSQLRRDGQRPHRAAGVVDRADDDLGADPLNGSFGHGSPLSGDVRRTGPTRRPRRVAGRCSYGGSRWVVGVDGWTAIHAGWWRGAQRIGTRRDGSAWAAVMRAF